jgi:hypothetical protein
MAVSISDINKKFDNIINIKGRTLSALSRHDRYMRYKRSQEEYQNKYAINQRNRKSPSFGADLIGTAIKMGLMFGLLKVSQFVADPKNKKVVTSLLQLGKGLFDIATKVAGFGADKLLDGVSQTAGNKSILGKLKGILIATVGFVSLRWLVNPLKIITDIKGLPKTLGKLYKGIKLLNGSLSDLAKWTKFGVTSIFKGIDKFFSRLVLKVFGKGIWSFLRKAVDGLYRGIGSVASKLGGGIAKGIGKMIPSPAIRAFGKAISKVPIVGALMGFGINLLLGDPIQKASVKLVTGGIGAWVGGAVGAIFPPAIPVTAVIGGVIGDWIGDTIYDKFVPPLALGGVVEHISTEGTHVIVAEKEDEVVIPLSMLTFTSELGAKLFEPMLMMGSSIVGSIQSVINSKDSVFANIKSDVSPKLLPLVKTFGSRTIISKTIKRGYTGSPSKNASLTNVKNSDKLLRTNNNISNIGNTTNTSVLQLLQSIKDVLLEDTIKAGKTNMFTTTNIPPAIVGEVQQSTTADKPGTFIARGRATYYDPNDPNDTTAGGHKLSTGERYDSNTFTGAVFPNVILKLPERYTAKTNERPAYFKGKTIKKPFMLKMVDEKSGKQAYIRINDVGIGVMGDTTRLVDMSAATKRYFGGDSKNIRVYLAPDDAIPGALPNLPGFAEGGEYKFNSAPHKRWLGKRRGRKHAGEDFDMNAAGTFQSFIGGRVMYRGFQPGRFMYGHYIDIHNDKLKVTERIAEAANISVNVGDVVQPGQYVSSGTSTGMIHYEIRKQDKYYTKFGEAGTSDPIKFLASIGAGNISGNIIKNAALASLMDGSTAPSVADSDGATPSDPNNANMQPIIASAAQPDFNIINKALVDLTQMLGVSKEKIKPNISSSNIMPSIDMNPDTSTNTNMIKIGDTTNITNTIQSILPNHSVVSFTRLRMV